MTTAGSVILAAREQHPAFNRDRHTDRLCLDHLSNQQASFFKSIADTLKDRVSQARTLATVISGSLVGVDSGGNAYAVTTGADGYAVAVGADGVPYAVGPVISSDPFADGFPLPSGSIEIVDLYATLASGQIVPIHWLEQRTKGKIGGGTGLIATVNGWRLLPLKNPPTAATAWDQVSTVTVVWIDQPAALTSLTDALTIPVVYNQSLLWDLCWYLARREQALDKDFPQALTLFFAGNAQAARKEAESEAVSDHRWLKERRMMRNR